MIYDFVANAEMADWAQGESSFPTAAPFYPEPQYPSPEEYYQSSGATYIGWDYNVTLINRKAQKLALLMYPYFYAIVTGNPFNISYPASPDHYLTGKFYVDVPSSAYDTYLQVLAGFRNRASKDPGPLLFRLFVNDSMVLDQQVQLYGQSTFSIPRLRVPLSPGSNSFELWVSKSGNTYGDAYAVWAVLKLWGTFPPPSGGGSGGGSGNGGTGPAQATFIQQANCRTGPGTEYDVVTSFSKGQTVQIFGRNKNFSNTWWYVEIPNTYDRCWVSLVTAQATGDFESIPVVTP